jgi:hypothetical protein
MHARSAGRREYPLVQLMLASVEKAADPGQQIATAPTPASNLDLGVASGALLQGREMLARRFANPSKGAQFMLTACAHRPRERSGESRAVLLT